MCDVNIINLILSASYIGNILNFYKSEHLSSVLKIMSNVEAIHSHVISYVNG